MELMDCFTKGDKEVLEKALKSGRTIVLYPASTVSNKFLSSVEPNTKNNIRLCDGDKNKHGKTIDGIKIEALSSISQEIVSPLFIITSYDHYYEIVKVIQQEMTGKDYEIIKFLFADFADNKDYPPDLKLKDFVAENFSRIVDVIQKLADERSKFVLSKYIEARAGNKNHIYEEIFTYMQYFNNDLFSLKDNEVFVDCGAYTGSEVKLVMNTNFKFIYSFEPSEDNYNVLRETIKDDRIKFFNAGVYSKNDTFAILNANSSGARLVKSNNSNEDLPLIQILRLDDVVDIPPTFIKMDIEGSEKEALIGAERLIKAYKPRLAICAYHKYEDIIELPNLIWNLCPDYKIYFRHHHPFTPKELVMYCEI